MKARRQARTLALQTLYEVDLANHPVEVVLARSVEDQPEELQPQVSQWTPEVMAFAARLRGYPDDRVERRVSEVLETTALQSYASEPIANLSHGFRQRVGIAQAIMHDPALVILDEPINGLDPAQIVEMRKLIRSLKEKHTVLLSSHILTEISQTCDRLMIIQDGRLVDESARVRRIVGAHVRSVVLRGRGLLHVVEIDLLGAHRPSLPNTVLIVRRSTATSNASE